MCLNRYFWTAYAIPLLDKGPPHLIIGIVTKILNEWVTAQAMNPDTRQRLAKKILALAATDRYYTFIPNTHQWRTKSRGYTDPSQLLETSERDAGPLMQPILWTRMLVNWNCNVRDRIYLGLTQYTSQWFDLLLSEFKKQWPLLFTWHWVTHILFMKD